MPPRSSTRAVVALYTASIFGGAFLIFSVQPMVGKHILPWFGGSPGVWSLCLAFYQLTLFGGYAYAHLLEKRVPRKWQPWVHGLLLAAALALLPILPPPTWKPVGSTEPTGHILAMLFRHVGLPFLMLAATGPLLQAWFARTFPGRSPYALYAVSNAGSLIALLSYPFLLEPVLGLSTQATAWAVAFAICGAAIVMCGWIASRVDGSRVDGSRVDGSHVDGSRLEAMDPAVLPDDGSELASPTSASPLGLGVSGANVALWIGLPASAVVLFMGVTNELCIDVASVPFLWVIPLAVYLVTFIVCFRSESTLAPAPFAGLAVIALVSLVLVDGRSLGPGVLLGVLRSVPGQVGLYSVALFSICMLVHGELHRLRPRVEALTTYYMCISGGGALGGLFVGLGAPRLFSDYYELPLGFLVCWAMVAITWWRARGHADVRPAWGLGLAAVALVLASIPGTAEDAAELAGVRELHSTRNFFGILRVNDVLPNEPRQHQTSLRSGTTTHGSQYAHSDARRRPTLYFGQLSGIGFVMDHRGPGERAKVGIVGLGTGTLAAYGRDGDQFSFYEIDPDVVRIAREDGYFSYLADSDAAIEVVLGDARLSMEAELREQGSRAFDLLVLDAFSSDAIPIHLLTIEAFDLYQKHLARNGVIVIHVSNSYLDLVPLLFRIAEQQQMSALEIVNVDVPRKLTAPSTWFVMSRDRAYLDSLRRFGERRSRGLGGERPIVRMRDSDDGPVSDAPVGLWTDDYSNLLGVLKPLF